MKNYFEIFELKEKFEIDLDELEAKYFSLQQQFHPDKASVAEIENSIEANKAYEVLKNPLRRALYILKLHGIDIENDETAVRPDMTTLEEILEIQEKLMQASADEIADIKTKINADVKNLIANAAQKLDNKSFAEAAQILVKAKYLSKILSDLKK